MGIFSFSSSSAPLLLLSLLFLFLFFQPSHSNTIVVEGLANWTKANPTVHVGETIILKYKQPLHNLYIFRNKRAFDICNFTEATLLDNGNSQSFTWYPSRTGFFYFSFSDKSIEACKQGEKAAVRVFQKDLENLASGPSIPPSAAPSPTSGGHFSATPAYNWPFRPRFASSPRPSPGNGSPAPNEPSTLPDSGGGMPFINSNPAVPLPTGETDAATIRPLPTSGHGGQVVVGLLQIQMLSFYMIWLMSLLLNFV